MMVVILISYMMDRFRTQNTYNNNVISNFISQNPVKKNQQKVGEDIFTEHYRFIRCNCCKLSRIFVEGYDGRSPDM